MPRHGTVAASKCTTAYRVRHTFSDSLTMHRRLALRIKQAALKAAHPARHGIVRGLRHHAASTRNQISHPRPSTEPQGALRAWLHTLLAALWARNWARSSTRRFSLRTLLRHSLRPRPASESANTTPRMTNRRPRRLGASAEWFSFAAR
jgi:hypothetical protein